MRRLVVTAVLAAAAGGGCTHLPLKRSTVAQARTLEDIYQQQVLDNLAKFVQNPGALPHFLFPNEGTATVTDEASGGSALGWTDFGFDSAGLELGGSRNKQQAWTMDPIRDPHKLALMRCAYQRALAGSGLPAPDCSDCDDRFNKFFRDRKRAAPEVPATCWFKWGAKKDLPADCSCVPVGHHCGVYVWVPPEGRETLTRLTLTILEFALFESDDEATKDVTLYLTAGDALTTRDLAAKIVVATVPLSLDVSETQAAKLVTGKDSNGQPLRVTGGTRESTFGRERRPTLLQLRNQLRTITPDAR